MARQEITTTQDVATFTKVDRLNLAKGESARLLMIEGGSWIVEWAHELRRSPKLTWEQKEAGQTETPEDFIGNFICLGRPEVIISDSSDPEMCPMCAAISESNGRIIKPKRGYAANILKYATPRNSTNLIQPVQVKSLAWVHRDENKRSNIKTLQEEWGDLRNHDLMVTCENMFQKYQISVAAKSAYVTDPAIKELCDQTYENNKYSDEELIAALGKTVTKEQAERQVAQVLSAAASVSETPVGVATEEASVAVPVVPPVVDSVDLTGFATPDSTTPVATVEAPTLAESSDDLPDLLDLD